MTKKRQLNIMVCVTSQRSCDKLIARGIERAGAGDPPAFLHVVHCVETGRNFMNTPYEADAIEYLFTAAQLAGAELSLVRADNVDDALVNYAENHGIQLIILGAGAAGADQPASAAQASGRGVRCGCGRKLKCSDAALAGKSTTLSRLRRQLLSKELF
jgi:K+-sensing histidine kinase KdpD